MPPRLPFSPASRQWLPRLFSTTPSASLHTSPPAHAFKNPSSASSSLMDIDDSPVRNPYIRRTGPARPSGDRVAPNEALQRIFSGSMNNRRMVDKAARNAASTHERLQAQTVTAQYTSQMTRRWQPGDTYAPHDLSPEESKKWRKGRRAEVDLLDALGLNPVDEYRNFAVISEYITPTGRIKHSRETGLRPVNQRKMAKAIRRAMGLGLHPSVHKHPEILNYMQRNSRQTAASSNPTRSLY